MKLIKSIVMLTIACISGISSANTSWPNHKPITVVVPFPAGSGTDAVARIFARELTKELDTNVIVTNRPGANGTIAGKFVANAKPDGYTVLMSTNTPLSAAPWLTANTPYDVKKDFTPIARGGNLPFILVTNPSAPYQTVQELVEYAKKYPGKVTYASGNSTGIVSAATLTKRTNTDMLHVPYKGTPQAITDLIGGTVDFMFIDLTSGMPFVKAKQVNPLAVTTATRTVLLPNLPSLQEAANIENVDINSWNGFLGPAKIPNEIVNTFNKAINNIVNNPEIKKEFATVGFDAFSGTPEDFKKFVLEQYDTWGQLIQDAGIVAE